MTKEQPVPNLTESEEEALYSKETEESVKQFCGTTIADLFKKLKKKIANYNIRANKIEKDIRDMELDVGINSDSLSKLEDKIEEIRTQLAVFNIDIQWKNNDKCEKESDQGDEKSEYDETKEESDNTVEECCWTCLHSVPHYIGAKAVGLTCRGPNSWRNKEAVHVASRCWCFVKGKTREYPPPQHLLEQVTSLPIVRYNGNGYARTNVHYGNAKTKFMGIDLNSGKIKCWE